MAPRRKMVRRKSRSRSRSRSRVIKGRGGYYQDMGGYYGQIAGSKLGSVVGYHGGRLAGSLLEGSGRYRKRSASRRSNWSVYRGGPSSGYSQPPRFYNTKSDPDSIMVRGRDYIKDITSSSSASTFSNETISLNPGLFSSFPWMSGVASQYQQYKFKQLAYFFKSTSANALNSTNTQLGTVGMVVNYDPTSPAPTSKAEIEQMYGVVSGRTSGSLTCMVECAKNQQPYNLFYIRYGNQAANTDLRLYDLGTLNIYTSGLQGTSVNVGELHVSYTIQFFKKRVNGGLMNFTGLAGHLVAPTPASTTIAATNLFSGLINATDANLTISTATANTFSLPSSINAGNWLFSYKVQGTAGAVTNNLSNGSIVYTNCQSLPIFAGASPISDTPTGTNLDCISVQLGFKVTGPSPSVYLGTSMSMLASPTYPDVFVIQLPGWMDTNT